jgi:hypothetical protein
MKEEVIRLLDSYCSSRIIPEPDSECITWTGRLAVKKQRPDYYPVMKNVYTKGAWLSVPRYTWSLIKGELKKHDKLRNACGNFACINPYHYEKKSEFCPKGHPRNEVVNYPIIQTWTKANGEELEILVIHCRICKREELKNYRSAKKALEKRQA